MASEQGNFLAGKMVSITNFSALLYIYMDLCFHKKVKYEKEREEE